jgi:hypothetical protein
MMRMEEEDGWMEEEDGWMGKRGYILPDEFDRI